MKHALIQNRACSESSIGDWIVRQLGIVGGGLIWSMLVSILGAVILIWLDRVIRKA